MKQTQSGKAFEFAILQRCFYRLQSMHPPLKVTINQNKSYSLAQSYFEKLDNTLRGQYNIAASMAVNFLVDQEPRLSREIAHGDCLQLELISDDHGKAGDVRDLLLIRSLQNWEIGVSAKNNHEAVKHPRLSGTIDFGQNWFGVQCSQEYWRAVRPIFLKLRELRDSSDNKALWRDLHDCHKSIYVPVLEAFRQEMQRLHKSNPKVVSQFLVEYLVGKHDFYKIVWKKSELLITAYNLRGTLGQTFVIPSTNNPQSFQPTLPLNVVPLPDRIMSFEWKANSDTTVLMELNNDWGLGFRIHSASSRIEPSLKFDVQLTERPKSLNEIKITLTT